MCAEGCLATVTLKVFFSLDLHVSTVNYTLAMAANTPSPNSQKETCTTPRTDTLRQSYKPARASTQRQSQRTARTDPQRKPLTTTRSDPNRRSFNTPRSDPKRRSLYTPRTDPNRRSFNTSRSDPNRRSLHTPRTDPNRRSFTTARTDANRRSFNTRSNVNRQSYIKSRQQTPEVPHSTTTEEGQEGGGMVLAPKWVVRLSASLAILGGAFLFSSVSVLTNSFGQAQRSSDGPNKTTGLIFMAFGCLSILVSLGLAYYGCRKRKKKEEDEVSDSGRVVSFAPAISTTADMFPWPSTPSSHHNPSGSPYSTPAAGQPPSYPGPQVGETPHYSKHKKGAAKDRAGHSPKASPGANGLQEKVELPIVSLPPPPPPTTSSSDPGPSHAS
nr:uncharacterized protein LOC123762278 isoform X2 [Procambarus clarkii]